MSMDALYKKACDAADKGGYDYAIALIREVLRAEPEYPKGRVTLRACERRREAERGNSILARTVRTLTRVPAYAKGLLLSSKPDRALEAFETFLMDNPSSVSALLKAGAAARKAGLMETSIEIFRDASSLAPNNKKALKALDALYEETGQRDEELRVVQKLVAIEPDNRQLQAKYKDLEALGHMERHNIDASTVGEGKFRDFVKDTGQAAELEKQQRYSDLSNVDVELRKAVESLKQDPDNTTKIVVTVRLYQQKEEYRKALDLLKSSLSRMPDNYMVREAYGDLILAKIDSNIRAIDAKLKKEPMDIESKQARAEFVRKRKLIRVKEYEWRVEQHLTDHALRLKLGHAYFDLEEIDKAIMAFQMALQDPRLQVEAAAMLGECFEKKGQYDLSIQQYQLALSRSPAMNDRGKDLHYKLAAAYERAGDHESALKEFKKLYSVDISFRDVAHKVEALHGQKSG